MMEQPLFLTTEVGVVTAMVTLPDGPPTAATMILQGQGITRSGINQTFTRLARSLAEVGVANLRSDYAGMAESWDADASRRIAGVRALVDAYREVTRAPLLLVASCYGLGPTAAICRQLPVAGAVLIAPPMRRNPDASYEPARRGISARAIARRVRDGKPRWTYQEQVERVSSATSLNDIVAHTPTVVMVGSEDTSTDKLRTLVPQLALIGEVELSVTDGLALHGARSRESQSAIHDGVLSWVARRVGADTRT